MDLKLLLIFEKIYIHCIEIETKWNLHMFWQSNEVSYKVCIPLVFFANGFLFQSVYIALVYVSFKYQAFQAFPWSFIFLFWFPNVFQKLIYGE